MRSRSERLFRLRTCSVADCASLEVLIQDNINEGHRAPGSQEGAVANMAGLCFPTHPGCDRDLGGLLVDLDTIKDLLRVEIEMNTHLSAIVADLKGPGSVRLDIYELRHLTKVPPVIARDIKRGVTSQGP